LWENVPQAARELALICDDPDAPTPEPWVHWLIYNIPSDVRSLPEHIIQSEQVESPFRASQGYNSWPQGENIGYRGPMPPRGHGVHHYHFKLYALRSPIQLAAGADKSQLLAAMQGHVLATASIVGTYERK
jgi:Raf kinase inhibitor-like YbhB/YbcL family protein